MDDRARKLLILWQAREQFTRLAVAHFGADPGDPDQRDTLAAMFAIPWQAAVAVNMVSLEAELRAVAEETREPAC